MKNTVKLCVDLGYNGVKVVLEDGSYYWCEAEVLSERYHTLPNVLSSSKKSDGVILYESSGERFAVAGLAASFKKSLHGEADLDDLHIENETRFSNPNLKRLCLASIYCALQKAGIKVDGDLGVEVAVAIPHMYLSPASVAIKRMLSGFHDFAIQIGDGEPVDVCLQIIKVVTSSQVINAIIGYAANDDGDMDKLDMDKDFPALFYDLGYFTNGICVVEPGMSISYVESIKEHSMMSANIRTAKKIQEVSKIECSHQVIETAVRSGLPLDLEWKFERGNEYSSINILDVQEQEITKAVNDLYSYTKEHVKLSFIRTVVIAGGTGARFFPELSSKFIESKLLDESKVHLATCTFKGNEYDSMYAVAVGGIKRLLAE